MSHCPKCGSWSVRGPRFVRGEYGEESLLYTCNQCGYDQREPTEDQKRGIVTAEELATWRRERGGR